jgi:hypothetical protein
LAVSAAGLTSGISLVSTAAPEPQAASTVSVHAARSRLTHTRPGVVPDVLLVTKVLVTVPPGEVHSLDTTPRGTIR